MKKKKLVYFKLWDYLTRHGMKRTDLLQAIPSTTLARLGKNETVNSMILGNICGFLDCEIQDICEVVEVTEEN